MGYNPLDYERQRKRRASTVSWRDARFGVVSLACAGFAVMTFLIVGCVASGTSMSFTNAWFSTMGLVLFCGGCSGVLGTDFDSRRGLATIGMFLNFGMLVVGCLIFFPAALSVAG